MKFEHIYSPKSSKVEVSYLLLIVAEHLITYRGNLEEKKKHKIFKLDHIIKHKRSPNTSMTKTLRVENPLKASYIPLLHSLLNFHIIPLVTFSH